MRPAFSVGKLGKGVGEGHRRFSFLSGLFGSGGGWSGPPFFLDIDFTSNNYDASLLKMSQ